MYGSNRIVSLSITSAKLTGGVDLSVVCQIHDFKPNEKNMLDSRGHLFLVTVGKDELSGRESANLGFEKVLVGRQIVSRFHEIYFSDNLQSPYEALVKASETVFVEYSKAWKNLELCAFCIIDDLFYASCAGGTEILLLREGNLITLAKSQEGGILNVSGFMKHGDIILASSKLFFEVFTSSEITRALNASDCEEMIENFAVRVRSQSGLSFLACVITKFETSEDAISSEDDELLVESENLTSVRAKLVGFLDQLISKFPDRAVVVNSEYVNFDTAKKNKKFLLVGLVLIALLGISVIFGLSQKRKTDSRLKYESSLNQAKHDLSEAEAVYSLNPLRARELIFKAKSEVQTLKDKKINDPEIDKVWQSIKDKLGTLGGIYEVEPSIYLDLTLVASGFQGDFISKSEDGILVLDTNNKRLINIDIGNKKTSTLAGPSELSKTLTGVAKYSGRSFILNTEGVDEIDGSSTQVVPREWGDDVLVGAYTGNLYVLDKKDSEIWRFQGADGAFSKKQAWFADRGDADLSSTTSWSLDGSIWVMSRDADVYRFNAGNKIAFSLTGFEGTINQNSSLYTSEDEVYLYILDSENQRILVFDKSGKYKAQYTAGVLKDAKTMIVSEKYKKIIFETRGILYSVEIKHL